MSADERWRFFLFLLAGGSSAVINILSRIALNWILPYEAAIVLAYLLGMTVAYLLNKHFVFETSGRGVVSESWRFALVNLAAVVQVWVVSVDLAYIVLPALGFSWHTETVAHVIGVAVPVFTSYLAHKHFSFATKA